MSADDIKELIEDRLSKLLRRVESAEHLKYDVMLGKHEQGVLDAITGTGGEQEFLELLLEKLK